MTTKTRRRVKLVTTFVAMIVTLCMTCFGIMAATSIAYDGTGYFRFSVGKNIATTISGSYGLKGDNDTVTNVQAIGFPDQAEDGDNVGEFTLEDTASPYSGKMTLPTIEVTNMDDVYVFTIIVKNDMATVDLKTQFIPSVGSAQHLTLGTVEYTLEEVTDGVATATDETVTPDSENWVNIPTGHQMVMTVTLQVADNAANEENGFSDAAYTFSLNVQRATTTASNN